MALGIMPKKLTDYSCRMSDELLDRLPILCYN